MHFLHNKVKQQLEIVVTRWSCGIGNLSAQREIRLMISDGRANLLYIKEGRNQTKVDTQM